MGIQFSTFLPEILNASSCHFHASAAAPNKVNSSSLSPHHHHYPTTTITSTIFLHKNPAPPKPRHHFPLYKEFGPLAIDDGFIVVDSSLVRIIEGVSLVFLEVNPEIMEHIEIGNLKGGLIAILNCSTAVQVMASTLPHYHTK